MVPPPARHCFTTHVVDLGCEDVRISEDVVSLCRDVRIAKDRELQSSEPRDCHREQTELDGEQ
jgi:hypothetical protein